MTIRGIDEARDELLEVLAGRDAALVIGAGASVPSGAPTAAELVAELQTRFKRAPIADGVSFLDAGTAVCNTPPYGRLDLVRAVCDRLRALEPGPAYAQLPRWRWRAIFTTNYDDLIEKAYASPARTQTIQPVNFPYDKFTVPRENNLPLFYLQGSIKAPTDDRASPVVCWADFLQTVQDRASALRLLRNVLVDGGKVIYAGYSFNDFLLEGILEEAVRNLGVGNTPYGYAILRGWPSDVTAVMHRVTRQNIIPIEGTFEEFADLVQEVSNAPASLSVRLAPPAPAPGKTIVVGAGRARVTENEASVYSEAFEVLSDEALRDVELRSDEEAEAARQFLRGEDRGWLPFVRDWAYKGSRDTDLLRILTSQLERAKTGVGSLLLVHGPAGLGKSVMARRLAFEAYTSLRVPTIIARSSWMTRPDMPLVDRLLDDVEEKLFPDDTEPAPLLMLIDRAELLEKSVPHRLLTFLRSRGRSAVIVLFARTNEYFRTNTTPAQHAGLGDLIEIPLTDTIAREDIVGLVHHIARLKIWDAHRTTDERFWVSYVEHELQSRFFDTIYSLVEQCKEPLSDRVWSEFKNLSETAQSAYLLIAALHQFGIGMKMEILMRALELPFSEFEREVIQSEARSILFTEHQTSELNIFFRGRSRIISQIVFERGLPRPGMQLPVFKRIIEATNPNEMFGLDELDALRTLLVQVFGPSGFDKRFDVDEVEALFAVASELIEDDVIEHHYGLLERTAKRYESAKAHLEKALRLSATLPYDLAAFRESPQHIENSLAQVLGDLALERLAKGDITGASHHFDEARQHFLSARRGSFPNAAAYDAHARMLWKRATRLYAAGSPDRPLALAEALDVIMEGIDNSNPEYRPGLVELQISVMNDLGLDEAARKQLERRAAEGAAADRARYELLLARSYVTAPLDEMKAKNLKRVLAHATRATELDPRYFPGWKLRAEAYERLHPTDMAGLLEILERAASCAQAEDNSWVLYEMAVAAFHVGNPEKSLAAFSKLRRASRGHALLSGVLELAGARGSREPYLYDGRVVIRRSDNASAIRCEELAAYGDIWFNPRFQRYYSSRVGDRVEFVVGFNYRGLLADELRRI